MISIYIFFVMSLKLGSAKDIIGCNRITFRRLKNGRSTAGVWGKLGKAPTKRASRHLTAPRTEYSIRKIKYLVGKFDSCRQGYESSDGFDPRRQALGITHRLDCYYSNQGVNAE